MDDERAKTELALPEYAALTDAQKIEHFNGKTTTVYRDAPIGEVIGYVETYSLIDALLAAQATATGDLAAAIGKTVRMFTNPRVEAIHMTDLAVRSLVDGMCQMFVAAEIWTQQQADGLLALGQREERKFELLNEYDLERFAAGGD